MAEVSRVELGFALRLWDGHYAQEGLQDKLEVHFSPAVSRALVAAVKEVQRDYLRLSPDANQVSDVSDVTARFVAVYPEVTQQALRRLAHSFCMSHR